MAINTSPTAQVQPPALPQATDEYARQYQDQLNNVLRLYFNSLNSTVSGLLESQTRILNNRVVIKEASDFLDVIDSTVEYFIDGIVDMGTKQLEIPAGGMYITGYNFDLSGLISSANNFTLFTSPVGGSGNVLMADAFITTSGTSSQVYNIVSATGNEAIETDRVNYIGCTSLGTVDNYRQGLEEGTGRFGGSPSLTLKGAWSGGYRVTTSIVRSLSAGMTEPLFKAGTGFVMQSRFLTDINLDLPTSAAFFDFSAINFPNGSTLQLDGCIITRNGVIDATDANITPNINNTALSSNWKNNVGVFNTFVGGLGNVTAEVETVITTQNVAVDVLGTFSETDLQHFDSPSNGVLRHIGRTPIEFNVTFDFVLVGNSTQHYRLDLVLDDGVSPAAVFSQTRVINNLAGGRDVAYYGASFSTNMNQNDSVYWQVTNLDSSQNCTLEIDSTWRLSAR